MENQSQEQIEQAIKSLDLLKHSLENLERTNDSQEDVNSIITDDFLDNINSITAQSNEMIEVFLNKFNDKLNKNTQKEYNFSSVQDFKNFTQDANDILFNRVGKFLVKIENMVNLIPVADNSGVETSPKEIIDPKKEEKTNKVPKSNFLEVASKDMPNITISFETFEKLFNKLTLHEIACTLQTTNGHISISVPDATYEHIIEEYENNFNSIDDVEIVFTRGVVEISSVEYVDIHSYVLQKLLMD